MRLLLDDEFLEARREVANGELAPLATSLAADLDRLLPDEDVFIPAEKAHMSRSGGRCTRDGDMLEFDPRSPHRHRCARCGSEYEGQDHYLWWIMGYQLWLAERAAHAALLARLGIGSRYRMLAVGILDRLAQKYPDYPNVDNVLGPTRLFFSTYLESIWLLQVAMAVRFLDDGDSGIRDRILDRIISPSSELIASFNEGASNRQVWNAAALAASGVLLCREEMLDKALSGPGGLLDHLRGGLLEDGSWYEGENYHLFAHRGLWYLVTIAESAGAKLPVELIRRFALGFVAPLRTALPDLTFPARRDSWYGVSLRQWRVAESLELGLARTPDDELLREGVALMYGAGPFGDCARWRSTAEAERNVPGVRLSRSDLGWKSLSFARPGLPVGTPGGSLRESVLLSGQGLGVFRRDRGATWIALDYGQRGGGHGHPDRLNLWLVPKGERVLEDFGTGSYVDPSLFWYRSTLAHNAPLLNRRSQPDLDGHLRAWEQKGEGGPGWIDAEIGFPDGAKVRRSVVVCDGYLVDRLSWYSTHEQFTLDLPWHVDGAVDGADWRAAELEGSQSPLDGFEFLRSVETSGPLPLARLTAGTVRAHVHTPGAHDWWRAVAPGPPGHGSRRFLILRCRQPEGEVISIWTWGAALASSTWKDGRLSIALGSGETHLHMPGATDWRIQRGRAREFRLEGTSARPPVVTSNHPEERSPSRPLLLVRSSTEVGGVGELAAGRTPGTDVLCFELGEDHYRRSELSWREAGSPAASVVIAAPGNELVIEVTVHKEDLYFAPVRSENPLDNENPDINSDGIQLHRAGEMPADVSTWLLIPEAGSPSVRISRTQGADPAAWTATWKRISGGYVVRARTNCRDDRFSLDVVVNEMPPPPLRERRRGQLVLSGARNEWVYLRGDRQVASRLVPIRIHDV